jgi:hypothetical protein
MGSVVATVRRVVSDMLRLKGAGSSTYPLPSSLALRDDDFDW